LKLLKMLARSIPRRQSLAYDVHHADQKKIGSIFA
jgi:hypothetical protein